MFQRIMRLLAPQLADTGIAALYQAIMVQSRQPVFYGMLAVPDTLDGRFDLLLLHMFLVLRRLEDAGNARQKLFDLMFADMDLNLRELGVGDMSIGKKIKPMISAFYGRLKAYEAALAEGQPALAEALRRNLYPSVAVPAETLTIMARYVTETAALLAGEPVASIVTGRIKFTRPAI